MALACREVYEKQAAALPQHSRLAVYASFPAKASGLVQMPPKLSGVQFFKLGYNRLKTGVLYVGFIAFNPQLIEGIIQLRIGVL